MKKLMCAMMAVACLGAFAGEVVELFNGKDLAGWYKFIKGRGRDNDPKGVFSVTNGVIRITGEELGGLVTEDSFSDYRLVVEYRWLGTRFPMKKNQALDSGILFHSFGPDGCFEGIWQYCHEYNLIQGATGDFWTVGPKPGKYTGVDYYLKGEAGAETLPGGHAIWKRNGRLVTLTGNMRLCRGDISRSWSNLASVPLSANEKPIGEWNTAVLECRGDAVAAWFNGDLVNRAVKVSPSRGRIQLQSEGCGIEFRRITLFSLKR